MRLRLSLVIPYLLAALLHGANAEPSGSSLYPPGLLPLINQANALLSARQFHDAAKVYSDAIEQSPIDYLLYYKRAMAYYSLSRLPAALADLDKVLSLTPFDKAHLYRARILTKEGRFSEAREAAKRYTSDAKDEEAQEMLLAIGEAESAAKKAEKAMRAKLWTACEEAATTALRTASHSVDIRRKRADCALAAGDVEGAVGDLTRLTHLTTPSTALLMKIFRLSYFLGPYSPDDAQSYALTTLKECLKFDPDSSQCLPAHRLVKSLDKQFKALHSHLDASDFRAVLSLLLGTSNADDGLRSTFEAALEAHTTRAALQIPSALPAPHAKRTSPRRQAILRALCRAHVKLGDAKRGERWCGALLEMEGMREDVDGLVGRGEALLGDEEWEEAVRAFERAFEASGRADPEIHQRLQKAQKLLRQSRKKDYYKVLGVPRDADAKAIKKAYRDTTKKAHPDKGGSEAKMAAVNEAYEVLSDPELRERFDNGDDPNDPMSQQGGHPFPGGPAGGAGGAGGGGPQQQFMHFFQQGGFFFRQSPPGQHGRGH
ncbi:uncharacterized protein LAESUDRAFT_719669 [Laetiporus sulphureus 93-53]|uniref:J domain-containing protein n=1 Tax=Laetiporus sulphureus 93-53 TaxID=1314785 RepID=A0A165IN18_9APHY|nr:uncharacterized protein LAESUDRAFT_719669 [Laetiporus sulphureus 93-53]KZT13306.1 hypothetical protein LAESUDRAFT_719669 [Laetiporus sulphureus 93-53]